jgi:uncharacterized protein YjbJ (UPF0337 family)
MKGATMGAVEQGKGKVKEAVGDVVGNPGLKEEGRAQKEKGQAESKAEHEKAKAKAHEAQAKEKEMEQRVARNMK